MLGRILQALTSVGVVMGFEAGKGVVGTTLESILNVIIPLMSAELGSVSRGDPGFFYFVFLSDCGHVHATAYMRPRTIRW